jgi:hypothetical protein
VRDAWSFGKNVVVRGTVVLSDDDGQRNSVPDGTVLESLIMEG